MMGGLELIPPHPPQELDYSDLYMKRKGGQGRFVTCIGNWVPVSAVDIPAKITLDGVSGAAHIAAQ